ncbi:hypothetical protein IFM89_012239 [Coptis chinensis]|uniref:Uncharacterized protein n=1 Tax=Coptis chinensis TaxID=261450 RepID=A0A835HE70_9MAGN|nr:hypothetical protein IFM89_012239 [Coptis chinensis]
MSPSMAPDEQNEPPELFFLGDKSFALHGEIMMVVLIFLFTLLLSSLFFCLCFRRTQKPIDEDSDHISIEIYPVGAHGHEDVKLAYIGDFKDKFIAC